MHKGGRGWRTPSLRPAWVTWERHYLNTLPRLKTECAHAQIGFYECLCPATLPAITTQRSPRCHLLVDTRGKGNYRAHREPRPRRAGDGWGTTDCSRARNRQQPAITASTTPKTKVRAQRSQLTLSKRASRELPVPVFGPVRGSPQSQSLRFRVATGPARLRD